MVQDGSGWRACQTKALARSSLQTYPPQDRPLTTLKESRPFIFYKHPMSQHSRPFGDLHKVRGPGTKQGQDKARGRKTPVPGICEAAGSAKTAWVGAKGLRPGPNRQRQRGLVGAKEHRKQGRRGPGKTGVRTASESQGQGQGPRAGQGQGGPAKASRRDGYRPTKKGSPGALSGPPMQDPTMCADSFGVWGNKIKYSDNCLLTKTVSASTVRQPGGQLGRPPGAPSH